MTKYHITYSGEGFKTEDQLFREIVEQLCGVAPPDWLSLDPEVEGPANALSERQINSQDWCAMNVPLPWMTGLSVIEAAELIIKGAAENANIHEEKDYERFVRQGH